MDYEYKVVKLHDFPHLVEQTAVLLSSEWPRSIAARCNNLQKSTDDFPCSLVLLQIAVGGGCEASNVVGYSCLSRVFQRGKSAIIESVVVNKKLRGHGLGRILMEASQNFAKSVGFEKLHLSTSDKCMFYEHLGYSVSYPVSPERDVSRFLKNSQNVFRENEQPVSPPPTTISSVPFATPALEPRPRNTSLSTTPPLSPAPQPTMSPLVPPPPPPLMKLNNHQHDTPSTKKTWMQKQLL